MGILTGITVSYQASIIYRCQLLRLQRLPWTGLPTIKMSIQIYDTLQFGISVMTHFSIYKNERFFPKRFIVNNITNIRFVRLVCSTDDKSDTHLIKQNEICCWYIYFWSLPVNNFMLAKYLTKSGVSVVLKKNTGPENEIYLQIYLLATVSYWSYRRV